MRGRRRKRNKKQRLEKYKDLPGKGQDRINRKETAKASRLPL